MTPHLYAATVNIISLPKSQAKLIMLITVGGYIYKNFTPRNILPVRERRNRIV